MKNILLFIFFCLFLLAYNSCKDTDDMSNTPSEKQLPDAHNTDDLEVFACRLNGEIWEPSYGVFNSIHYTYHEPSGGFVIGADRKNNSTGRWEQLALFAKIFDIGEYTNLDDEPYSDTDYCDNLSSYTLDTLSTNVINIDILDKNEGIIIGTFKFTAINTDCNKTDTVRVTEGRFKATL